MPTTADGLLTGELRALLAFAAGARHPDGGFGHLAADGSLLADQLRAT